MADENQRGSVDFLVPGDFCHEAVELAQIGKITSDRYARIAALLKQQGTPIPTNDIWIAAQTMEHGAELITSDHHFERISGLVCTIF
ncbi:MAG: PIN domain-containing protein [Desulfobacterales bacterium]|nr:PIN domain-containing protein [Desulfobacterales bacterium]